MLSPSAVLSSGLVGLFGLVLLAVLVGCLIMAIRYLTRMRGRRVTTTLIPDNVALSIKPILTEAEARFLRSLENAVDGEYLVWPQLPLWTFIETRSNDTGAAAAVKNRISLKRVDFCLVDRETGKVHMAIELDDRTHQRADRQHRDAFVQDVLKQIGVPLIRILAAKAYEPQAIQRQLGIEPRDFSVQKLA